MLLFRAGLCSADDHQKRSSFMFNFGGIGQTHLQGNPRMGSVSV